MSTNLPKPDDKDMAQILREGSLFALNGFAALDIPQRPLEDDNKSDGGDSLFVSDGPGDYNVDTGNYTSSVDKVKHEEVEPNHISQLGVEVPPGQFPIAGSSSTAKNSLCTSAMSSNPKTEPNHVPKPRPQKNNSTVEEDSDDDLMIIDKADVPAHVMDKFSANPWQHRAPDLEIVGVRIKHELGTPPPLIELGSNAATPEIKEEHRSDNASLFGDVFGDVFGDDDLADHNSDPTAVPAAPDQSNDEVMFVDEPIEPAADIMPMNIDDVVNNEEHLQANDGVDAVPGADAAHVAEADNSSRESMLEGAVVAPGMFGAAGSSRAPGSSGTAGDDADDGDGVGEGGDGGHSGPSLGADSDGPGAEADDDEEFVVGDDQELSDGEQPRSRRRRPPRSQKAKQKRKAQGSTQRGPDLSLEDLEDDQLMIQAELSVLKRRKEMDRTLDGDAERLKYLAKKSAILGKKLANLHQKSLQGLAQKELQKMVEQDDSEEEGPPSSQGNVNGQARGTKQRAPDTRIPALVRKADAVEGGPSTQKRKWQLPPGHTDVGPKRQRKNARSEAADIASTTEVILNSIKVHDPIMARAQMDDFQIFNRIEATTVEEQMRKLREQINATPDVNERRVRADLKQLESARKLVGGKKFCKAFHGQWKITGLKKPLHHYQLVGVGWMLHRELDQHGPFGGILADSVGLGKTVEAIACVLGNRLGEKEKVEGKYGTLIVVPSNLLAQWQDEIDECCGMGINVVHYYSGKHNRVRMSNVQRADIVITTYYEVCKAYPKKEKLAEYEHLPLEQQNAKFNEMLGKIFHIEWHRVILDEAHLIKNHNSHTSKACTRLQGKYRWALTGTPVHNGLHEIYPYMQFLRAADGETFKEFKRKYTKSTSDSLERIKSFVDDVMMVRRIDSLFLGKALFDIPATHPLPNIWITLSDEENIIYRRIESKIRGLLNSTLASDDAEERKRVRATFFAIAMRLRQAVSHPFLLFPMMRDFFEYEDILEMREKMEEIRRKYPNRPFVTQIGSWCETLVQGRLEGKVTASNLDEPFGKGDHGLEFNMLPHFEKLEKVKTLGASMCSICSEKFSSDSRPRTTKCNHVFCADCVDDMIETEREQGNNEIHCPMCNKKHSLNEFLNTRGPQGSSQSQPRRRQARRAPGWNDNMPGNDWRGYQPLGIEDSAEFLKECDGNAQLTLAPSAKTTMVKNIILKWQKEHPDDKIIVFTQWVMVARILGRVLEQERIDFLYFFGEMSREEKEDNLNVYRELDNVKVLVASLKCGGQGLNLTCANRVIMIDPWWNSALESQGYGRVFRMGQTKETYYVRLLTRNTIDGRMAKLQAKKLKEINGVVTDYDSARTQPKLEEVAQLFGRVTCDNNGKPLAVEEDYDTDEEGGPENRAGTPDYDGQEVEDVDGDQVNGGGRTPGMPGYGDSRVSGYGIQDLV